MADNSNKRANIQYLPASGPLPGKSFEEQTEGFLNDLWAAIGGDIGDVEEAIRLANEALQAASNALLVAQNAETIAENAASQIGALQTQINNIQTQLITINENITYIEGVAQEAQTNANDALTKTTQIEENVTNLENEVEQVKTDVTNALSVANAAQAGVDILSEYTYEETEVDLDSYILVNRLYIANLQSANLPNQEPGYLTVDLTSEIINGDLTTIYYRQIYQCDDTGEIFVRFGETVIQEGEENVTTWYAWR